MKKAGIILLFVLFAIPLPFAILFSLISGFGMLAMSVDPSALLDIIVFVMLMALAAMPYIPIYIFSLIKTWREKKVSLITFAPAMHLIVVGALVAILQFNPIADFIGLTPSCFGLNLDDHTVVESLDTHGGFHGDGTYFILDCSKNREKALEGVRKWDKLPLPENVDLLMFGKENSWYKIADEAKMPRVENGYYVFRNRSSNKAAFDESGHIENFTIAVYDTDTDMMYYFEWDT